MRALQKAAMVTAMASLIVHSVAAAPAKRASEAANPASEIDQIIGEIQVGLLRAQNEAAARNLPALKSVTLELETEFAYSAGGELNLYVVSVGGNIEKDKIQRLSMTLTPPAPYSEEPIAQGEISENLSSAILAAAQGVANTRKRKPPLALTKLEAEIRFVVKATGKAGVKLEILPITADIKGDISKNAVQAITVSFEEKP